jgi:hypothetical protein
VAASLSSRRLLSICWWSSVLVQGYGRWRQGRGAVAESHRGWLPRSPTHRQAQIRRPATSLSAGRCWIDRGTTGAATAWGGDAGQGWHFGAEGQGRRSTACARGEGPLWRGERVVALSLPRTRRREVAEGARANRRRRAVAGGATDARRCWRRPVFFRTGSISLMCGNGLLRKRR